MSALELKLHAAICRAVEILNIAPEVARISEGRQVRDVLRQALAEYADDFMNQPAEEGERSKVAEGHQRKALAAAAENSAPSE